MPEQEPSAGPNRAPGDPYCSNCGYTLTALTESSKCPECGRPLVEVLVRSGTVQGRRFRTTTRLFGLPLIDIALGAAPGEKVGRAKGIIAIGDVATGLLAIGGRSYGVVAVGGFAVGGFTLGGFSLGVVSAIGGCAVALGMAWGGVAIALLSSGGLAAGYVASGGLAIGYHAIGGGPIGVHTIGPGANDQATLDVLSKLTWFFGPMQGFGLRNMLQPVMTCLFSSLSAAAGVGLLAVLGHMKGRRGPSRFGADLDQ